MSLENDKINIAISGCLIGEEIRFDGQHKRHPHVVLEFNEIFNFTSFCPEVAMGLGIPRRAIKLIESKGEIRLVDSKDFTIDHTDLAYATYEKMYQNIKNVSGMVFTKKSPSCGYDPVPYHDGNNGYSKGKVQGLWAQFISAKYPRIPMIDSGRLYDDHLRATFKTQVLVYDEFQKLKKIPKNLIHFHETHKFYLLQYGAKNLTLLGGICAGVSVSNCAERFESYGENLFCKVFKCSITTKSRVNVVEHMAGFLKKLLSKSDKTYLHDNIKAYHKEKLQFESILMLIEFIVKSYQQDYLLKQKIFQLYSKK